MYLVPYAAQICNDLLFALVNLAKAFKLKAMQGHYIYDNLLISWHPLCLSIMPLMPSIMFLPCGCLYLLCLLLEFSFLSMGELNDYLFLVNLTQLNTSFLESSVLN